MGWFDILKAKPKANKVIGSSVRQAIANYLEETGRKNIYTVEEIISLFPKYIEITGQQSRTALKKKFEELVMRYTPEGYGKLREMYRNKDGTYNQALNINAAITGWEKLRE